MQLSRAFMIYELGIETWISPRATESQTYMSQFKSKARKERNLSCKWLSIAKELR